MNSPEQNIRLSTGQILQGIAGDLEDVGFVLTDKQVNLQTEEMRIAIRGEVIPWHGDSEGIIRQCNLVYTLDDVDFPRESTLIWATQPWHLDELGGRVRNANADERTEYVVRPGQQYEDTEIHRDMLDFGIQFFASVTTRQGYFDYLLGDRFRNPQLGDTEVPDGVDLYLGIIALDLAHKLHDKEKIAQASHVINRHLREFDDGRSRRWLEKKDILRTVDPNA